ncbi:hypothetical protein M885DRAFT_549085 [Pelagophyceae sp. CCMP2097]|nr:hypothetical protein M885DRAFT_549085 [Pelagophyceae sp. CCMP2097]|mmetsp:Transcript_11975/g.41384  ORF Transcript_11975/g.41384 Transcript_11975/m.41384 type:complete len:143 (+) Transcript_11975:42-470(+)
MLKVVVLLLAARRASGFAHLPEDICEGIRDSDAGLKDLDKGLENCAAFEAAGLCNADSPLGSVGTYYCVDTCGTTGDMPGAAETCRDRCCHEDFGDNDKFVAYLYGDLFGKDVSSCADHVSKNGNDLCGFPSFAYLCPCTCE